MPFSLDTPRSLNAQLAPLSGRSLTVLFDLSNKCNLRCRFCYFSYDSVFHRPPVMMTPELFERIAIQVLPLARVVYLSAGSESLMNPHFKELLRICASHAPPTTKLLTNGVLLDRETIDALIEFELSELHVSVDAPDQETYEYLRRGSSWNVLRDNVALLQERKADVNATWPLLQFNVILLRSNLNRLNEFVDLALEWGADRIACRHLMPYQDLGMEAERTDGQPEHANRCFLNFLEYAQAKGIMITSFPDFYSLDDEPWRVPLRALPMHPAEGPLIAAEAEGPLGHWDTPANKSCLAQKSIDLEGWALSYRGPCTVEVSFMQVTNSHLASEDPAGAIVANESARNATQHQVHTQAGNQATTTLLGRGTFLNAVRPDVTAIHKSLPAAFRCGWRFRLQAIDLPEHIRSDARILVHAVDPDGTRRELGSRTIRFSADDAARPHLYCTKPFEDVYIDPEGNIYPYPDCQTVKPFGSLSSSSDFRSIWFGVNFEDLRQKVMDADPPPMCQTCPDFINRNVDDSRFFLSRDVEPALRRPLGYLDQPGPTIETDLKVIKLRGWALAYGTVKSIDLFRDTDNEREHICSIAPGTEDREDVTATYPRLAKHQRAGWSHDLDLSPFPLDEPTTLLVVACSDDNTKHTLGKCIVTPRRPR